MSYKWILAKSHLWSEQTKANISIKMNVRPSTYWKQFCKLWYGSVFFHVFGTNKYIYGTFLSYFVLFKPQMRFCQNSPIGHWCCLLFYVLRYVDFTCLLSRFFQRQISFWFLYPGFHNILLFFTKKFASATQN